MLIHPLHLVAIERTLSGSKQGKLDYRTRVGLIRAYNTEKQSTRGKRTMALTSTTAPGKVFASRSEIAEHYKSDWHKYNLKRREAGLPLVEEKEFQIRLEAALAMRKEKEKKNGTDHIKNINSKKNKKKQQKNKARNERKPNDGGALSSSADADMASADNASEEEAPKSRIPAALAESQENPEIDPKQCLFDQHKSKTLKDNINYMQQKYGFFLPDKEFLVDVEGLLGYCHEKIKLGHYCLYCDQ
jgi:pre-60S factor REI1